MSGVGSEELSVSCWVKEKSGSIWVMEWAIFNEIVSCSSREWDSNEDRRLFLAIKRLCKCNSFFPFQGGNRNNKLILLEIINWHGYIYYYSAIWLFCSPWRKPPTSSRTFPLWLWTEAAHVTMFFFFLSPLFALLLPGQWALRTSEVEQSHSRNYTFKRPPKLFPAAIPLSQPSYRTASRTLAEKCPEKWKHSPPVGPVEPFSRFSTPWCVCALFCCPLLVPFVSVISRLYPITVLEASSTLGKIQIIQINATRQGVNERRVIEDTMKGSFSLAFRFEWHRIEWRRKRRSSKRMWKLTFSDRIEKINQIWRKEQRWFWFKRAVVVLWLWQVNQILRVISFQ